MDEDRSRVQEEVDVTMSPVAPEPVQGAMETESPRVTVMMDEGDKGHLSLHLHSHPSPTSEFNDWELLNASSSPSSPRSSSQHHAEGAQADEALVQHSSIHFIKIRDPTGLEGADNAPKDESVEVVVERHEPLHEAPQVDQDLDRKNDEEAQTDATLPESQAPGTPPDSPRMRSGTSSFSHISSPASYHFTHSGEDESDGSHQWTSDEEEEVQSKDSEKEAPRSEADSEEAIQDVVAVSQEGSLGSLSDSDAGFSPLANRGSRQEGKARSFSFPQVAALALDLASVASVNASSPVSPRSAASAARCTGHVISADVDALTTPEAKETADAALKAAQEITAAVAAEFGSGKGALSKGMEAKEGDATSLPFAGITNISQAVDEASCPKKHKAVDIVGALRAGMDKLVAATQSTLQGIGSSEVVQRFWVCLQEWASALMACMPAAERARARLQIELARLRARSKRIAWSQVAWAASLAIMAVIAGCALVKNAALHRALRRKDQEMNQLILMVFNLQESLQGAARSSRVPIVRHACAVSSYPQIAPVGFGGIELLGATKAIYC